MSTTSDKAGTFFHGFADTFDTFYDGKRSPFMQWIDRHYRSDMFERYRLTFERLGDFRGKSVIDIGCGSGPYVVEALKQGAARVTAFDPAPRMLELTKERVERIQKGDAVDYKEGLFPQNKPQGPYDYAIVMGVMDYVPDKLAFLKGLREIITDKAVASFPSQHWFRTPFRKVRYWMRNCPLYYMSKEEIERVGKQAGWSSVEVLKIPGAGMDYHVCFKA